MVLFDGVAFRSSSCSAALQSCKEIAKPSAGAAQKRRSRPAAWRRAGRSSVAALAAQLPALGPARFQSRRTSGALPDLPRELRTGISSCVPWCAADRLSRNTEVPPNVPARIDSGKPPAAPVGAGSFGSQRSATRRPGLTVLAGRRVVRRACLLPCGRQDRLALANLAMKVEVTSPPT